MNTYYDSTDAKHIYRDTSAVSTLRTDSTADTGNLLQLMRDAVIVFGPPNAWNAEDKIPELPGGSIDAVSRG